MNLPEDHVNVAAFCWGQDDLSCPVGQGVLGEPDDNLSAIANLHNTAVLNSGKSSQDMPRKGHRRVRAVHLPPPSFRQNAENVPATDTPISTSQASP
jgi:hypothetical protein